LTNQVHLKIQFRHRFDQKCPFTDSLHRLGSRFAQTSSVPLEKVEFRVFCCNEVLTAWQQIELIKSSVQKITSQKLRIYSVCLPNVLAKQNCWDPTKIVVVEEDAAQQSSSSVWPYVNWRRRGEEEGEENKKTVTNFL